MYTIILTQCTLSSQVQCIPLNQGQCTPPTNSTVSSYEILERHNRKEPGNKNNDFFIIETSDHCQCLNQMQCPIILPFKESFDTDKKYRFRMAPLILLTLIV